jgi:hypothetical protein
MPYEVPEMRPCPGCSLILQLGEGPNGLAFHLCNPQAARELGPDPRELVENAARDPDLTPDQATVAMQRMLLARMLDGDAVSGVEIGEIIVANAKATAASGGSSSDERLYAFLRAREDEEKEDGKEKEGVGP